VNSATQPHGPRILWVHNNGSLDVGMFMWDIWDESLGAGSRLEEAAIPVSPSPVAFWCVVRDLRRRARTADLVHAQYGSLVGLTAALLGRPLIVTLRGSDSYFGRPPNVAAAASQLLRILFSYIAALRAETVIVMSYRMRREVRRWPFLRRKRVVVITDPIGTVFWPATLQSMPREDGAETLRVLVGSQVAGNPIKRIWIVQSATELCCAAGLPIRTDYVAGVSRSEFKAALEASDIVALPSTHEGWPNVVKEALVCGLTFVATDVSDLPELAGPFQAHRIVEASPVDFALAFCDLAIAKRWRSQGLDPVYSHLHPMAVAIKHSIIYAAQQRSHKRPLL
jgi:teichuronic acid biosynthesis glycosyltransferase TuaC